jgi:OOP family OmpA-OmpF porin
MSLFENQHSTHLRIFMKKYLLVALVGTALTLPILAQAQVAYIGASVGRAESEFKSDGMKLKDSDTGFKVNAGYDFTPNFGVEVGYADLGKPTFTAFGATANAEPRSYYLAGTATYPIDQHFSVFAKAGVTRNRTKITIVGDGNETFTHTAAILGVGGAYNFSKNVALVLEYENFDKTFDEQGETLKTDMVSIGLRYKF